FRCETVTHLWRSVKWPGSQPDGAGIKMGMPQAVRHLQGPVRRSAPSPRRHRLGVVEDLRTVKERGDSPVTAVLVVAQVALALVVVVGVELVVAFAFYFGW